MSSTAAPPVSRDLVPFERSDHWVAACFALRWPGALSFVDGRVIRRTFWGDRLDAGFYAVQAVAVRPRRALAGIVVSWAVEVTVRWRKDGQVSDATYDVLYADRKTAVVSQQELIAAIGGDIGSRASAVAKRLGPVVLSARQELWSLARYVRGSEMRRWQVALAATSVQRDLDTLRRIVRHPLSGAYRGRRADEALVAQIEDLLSEDPHARRAHNAAVIEREATTYVKFFKTVERKPLTPEQVRAVLAFDDVNMAVAAAGSGKTSVLVGKAGYALLSKFCEESEILGPVAS